MSAVVVPYDDGFMAVGLHYGCYGVGADIDDALEQLVQECGELQYAAETIGSDVAMIVGRSNLAFLRAATKDIDERELPREQWGYC